MGKRKAAVLALLGGYGSGSEEGSGSGSEESAGASPQSPAEGPVQGPAGPPEDEAPAGPAWPPQGAYPAYEELPEAPPEEADAADSVEGALAGLRHVSVPPELVPPGVLPPPVPGPVRPELQAKLERFAQLTAAGRSITGELRGSRGYRNPDFLGQLVVRFGVREHASAYPPAVFDPEALPAEDYFDALVTAQRVAAEEKEAERKRSGRVDFVPPWSREGAPAAPPPAWRPGQLPVLPLPGGRR